MVKTAGILIIGDEILNGHVVDTNSTFLMKKLWNLGVLTQELRVIKDSIDGICKSVQVFSKMFDIVVLAGGTGSTHDDLTYQAVAKAFSEECHIYPNLCKDIQEFFGLEEVSSAVTKLATLPKSSQLHYHPDASSIFPLVQVMNVYILPGVPKYLTLLFDTIMPGIISTNSLKSKLTVLECRLPEIKIAEQISQVQKKFSPEISIGVYPVFDSHKIEAKIHVEGTNDAKIRSCTNMIFNIIPTGFLAEMTTTPRQLSCDDIKHLDTIVSSSTEIINKGLIQYGMGNIALAFNGGKDCTALLHLLLFSLEKLVKEKLTITAICIDDPDNFPEIEEFIDSRVKFHNLNMLKFKGKIKDGLFELHRQIPQITAIFMGTRSTDPFSCNLASFSPCDEDWPPLMRINPIISWSYNDVWLFLQKNEIPYCSLYDQGYTSIGNTKNTKKNPALLNSDTGEYKPAYCLSDGTLERAGRL